MTSPTALPVSAQSASAARPADTAAHPSPQPAVVGHGRAIVKALLLGGPHSRSDLATKLDLSAGSLTRLTKPLIAAGIIIEQPPLDTAPGLGRPSVPLAFNHDAYRFIGIKLTQTHAYGALTRADASVLFQFDLPLTDQSPAAALAAITAITGALSDQAGATFPAESASSNLPSRPAPEQSAGPRIAAIGISLGGHVSDYRTVTHADHLGWDHVPLAALVEEATGIAAVVENDIVAQTEFTHWFGQGADADSFALFTLGAGIGYGLVTHGHAVGSPEAGYSLLSHFPLVSTRLFTYAEQIMAAAKAVANGSGESTLAASTGSTASTEPNEQPSSQLTPWPLLTSCNHVGCATAMLTLRGLEQRATSTFGRPVTFQQLLGLANAGDPTARLLADASGYALGTALAAISNLTLVPKIVLGGEACELANVAGAALLAGLHDHRDPRTKDPQLHFQAPDLALWAQGAAVVAVHNTILGRN